MDEATARLQTIQNTKDAAAKFQKATDGEIASLHKRDRPHCQWRRQAGERRWYGGYPQSSPDSTVDMAVTSNALADQYKQFTTLRDRIESKMEPAAKLAETARDSFDHAIAAQTAYISWLKTNDPKEEQLIKLEDDKDIHAMLLVEKIAASYDKAQAYLIGLRVAQLEKGLSPNLDEALKAANLTAAPSEDVDQKNQDATRPPMTSCTTMP